LLNFKKTALNYSLISFLILVFCCSFLAAWDRGTVAYEGGYKAVIEPLMPSDSTHLLGSSPGGPELALSLRNLKQQAIQGAVLYLGITDFTGKGIQDFTERLDLPADRDTVIRIKAGLLDRKPGFYDVRVFLFENGRELGYKEFSFGYDVRSLPVKLDRPPDFDSFWRATLDSLKGVPLSPVVLKDTLLSTPEVDVCRVSFSSFRGVRVYGWYTVPRWKQAPHAALLFFPGYSSGRISPRISYSELGYATLSIQVRGYDVDQESYPEDNQRYMTLGIASPESYIYREITCHCLRAVDFVWHRPEIDRERIGVAGGSQGGGLALLTAGLDPRIKAAVAGVPFLTDFPRSMTMTGNPYRDVVRYIESHPESKAKVMRTVSYFDVLNLAQKIEVPVLVSMGLYDRTCPAPSIYGMFTLLASTDKTAKIYPYFDHHEVYTSFSKVERDWLKAHLPPVAEGNSMISK